MLSLDILLCVALRLADCELFLTVSLLLSSVAPSRS